MTKTSTEHDVGREMYKWIPQPCPICETSQAKFIGWRGGASHRANLGVECKIWRCRRCSLVYPNSMPIPVNGVGQHYSMAPDEYFQHHDTEVKRLGAFRLLARAEELTGGNSAGDFLKLLRNGKAFGLKHLNYTYQEGEGGIAAALSLVEEFVDGEPVCVVLGDNIIEENICKAVRAYQHQGGGAKIILKKVTDPQRFGVPELDGRRVLRIEEKPAVPKSDYAVIGVYMYDTEVFNIIRTLKPSGRGELEITDVNNAYIERDEMTWDELEGWWTDAGTFESLLHASNLVAKTGANKLESTDAAQAGHGS